VAVTMGDAGTTTAHCGGPLGPGDDGGPLIKNIQTVSTTEINKSEAIEGPHRCRSHRTAIELCSLVKQGTL